MGPRRFASNIYGVPIVGPGATVGAMVTRVPLAVCLWAQTLTLSKQGKGLLDFRSLARSNASSGGNPSVGLPIAS